MPRRAYRAATAAAALLLVLGRAFTRPLLQLNA